MCLEEEESRFNCDVKRIVAYADEVSNQPTIADPKTKLSQCAYKRVDMDTAHWAHSTVGVYSKQFR